MATITWARYRCSKEECQRYHTPFCPRKHCRVNHHELVNILCEKSNSVSGDLSVEMKQCIEMTKTFGWDKNSDVPDPLKALNSPLLLLACAFGKADVVEGLLRNNFDPGVVNQQGETALHAAANHLYNSTKVASDLQMNVTETLDDRRSRENAFERILHSLTAVYPKILAARDNAGLTALHVLSRNILHRNCCNDRKKAVFHRFCFKAMIKRLLELESAIFYHTLPSFTRHEILDIIKAREHQNGDSVLHILASDWDLGFKTLKFILDLFFPGKLPDEKNKQGNTAFSIAWDTDSERALKLFFSGPSEDVKEDSQEAAISSFTTQSKETRTPSNDENQRQIVINIDIMEPDENNSNIPGGFNAVATGHPLPKVVVTSFDPNADSSEQELQKIQQSLSEDSEELAEDSSELVSCEGTLSVASSENEVTDVDTSTWELTAEDCSKSSFRDSESSRSSSEIDVVEVKTNSSRKRKINPNVDDSYIELTRDGIGFAEVDALAKATLVGVLLTNYQHKIKQVEESLVKIRQQREQDAIALNLKKVKMKLLKKEMDLLKQEISAKKRNVQELEKKEDLLCKEKVNLKEKATHCQTLKSQYEDNHEKGSLK